VLPDDAAPDGPSGLDADPCRRWFTHFPDNPTAQDLNADGVQDFRPSASPSMGGIMNGPVWQSNVGDSIATNPADRFAAVTRLSMVARAIGTGLGDDAGPALGANVGLMDADGQGQVFAVLSRVGSVQSLVMFQGVGDGWIPTGAVLPVLPPDFLRIELVIDVRTHTASISAHDEGGTLLGTAVGGFQESPANDTEGWAQMKPFRAAGEFKSFTVASCPD
jgi:hypothetical protein